MGNFIKDLFRQTEKPQSVHPPSTSQGFSQYDTEYVTYCIEQEQALSQLEAELRTTDDPKEVAKLALQTACEFYAADWAGIIELDMELDIATPGWWYNPDPKITSLQKKCDYENFMSMPTWAKCIKQGEPIVVLDVAEAARVSEQEYQVYKRFDVRSLIAVSFSPSPIGFVVIRNPSRYKTYTSTLKSLAYVLHRAMAQRNCRERARMTLSPEEIKSDKDMVIKFFGDLEITTQDGVWKEHDFHSPKSSRAVAYIMLQKRSAHPALAIADALYPEDNADVDTINKNIRGYIYRFRKSFELISKHKLIEYTSNGYRLNPALNIRTDLDQFEEIWELVQQDTPITHKVYMLKRAIKLYKGAVFQSASDDHWLVGIATEYKMKYISMVNELLSILADFEDYDGVHHFALKSLKLVPENVKAHYWLIYSMYYSGAVAIAKKEIEEAKFRLTEEEYTTLLTYINRDFPMQKAQIF